MSRLLIALVIGLMTMAPVISHASQIRMLRAHPTVTQLKAACGAAGGSYSEIGGEYSCTVEDCDGEGGTCGITCTSQGCWGVTPRLITGPLTFIGILQNGDNVVHDQQSVNLESLVSGQDPQASAPGPGETPKKR